MSLAIFAAPFENDNYDSYNFTNETPITKKRNLHNKTQKRNDYNSSKVNAVLESIHNTSQEDNDLGDFQPLNPPTSMGVENTKLKEGMSNNYNSYQPKESDTVDLQYIKNNFLNDKAVEKYYQNLIPNYKQSYSTNSTNSNTNSDNSANSNTNTNINFKTASEYNKPYYPIHNINSNEEISSDNYNTLVEKLNYMINLLEEQQDEKTNNVTEEVVLYSFLGIFIIFIVDSFARVGKYIR